MRYSSRYLVRPRTDIRLNYQSPQAEGLVAWWPLRDGSAVARDYSGYGYHIGRCPTQSADPTFDGSPMVGANSLMSANTAFSDHNDIPTQLRFSTDDNWAISVWKIAGDVSGEINEPNIFETKSPTTSNQFIYIRHNTTDANASGNARATGQTGQVILTSGLTSGKWHQIVYVWNGVTRIPYLYADGLLHATGTTRASGANFWATGDDLHIGISANHGLRHFIGGLCDLRIYKRSTPFTDQQVYEMWHPLTRWDLYRPAKRYWQVDKKFIVGPFPTHFRVA